MKKSNSCIPDWELFEIQCTDYLNSKFNDLGFNFIRKGGSDSTETDISIYKNIHIVGIMSAVYLIFS